ncbi:MAG: hypothetical protein Q9185_005955 [Variospora sp. 1 TL-2023]
MDTIPLITRQAGDSMVSRSEPPARDIGHEIAYVHNEAAWYMGCSDPSTVRAKDFQAAGRILVEQGQDDEHNKALVEEKGGLKAGKERLTTFRNPHPR